eukprot:scaffold9496_cov40-Attheya_sp.AAC.1
MVATDVRQYRRFDPPLSLFLHPEYKCPTPSERAHITMPTVPDTNSPAAGGAQYLPHHSVPRVAVGPPSWSPRLVLPYPCLMTSVFWGLWNLHSSYCGRQSGARYFDLFKMCAITEQLAAGSSCRVIHD